MSVQSRIWVWALVLIGLSAGARGQSQVTHGNAAEAMEPSKWSSVYHAPYGLEGYLLPNQTTVVTLPLGTAQNTGRVLYRVKALFYAAPDVHVTRMELWDGGTEVKWKTGSWIGNLYITMKTPYNYQVQHGLCISLTLVSGASADSSARRFVLNSGGADYKILIQP